MHKILIIEDDAAISNLIKSALTREGYSCEIASDGLIGEQMFDSGSWDLVLLDLMLPGTSAAALRWVLTIISESPSRSANS